MHSPHMKMRVRTRVRLMFLVLAAATFCGLLLPVSADAVQEIVALNLRTAQDSEGVLLSWDQVPHAESYMVVADGEDVWEVYALSLLLPDVEAGTETDVAVLAVDGDGRLLASGLARVLTFDDIASGPLDMAMSAGVDELGALRLSWEYAAGEPVAQFVAASGHEIEIASDSRSATIDLQDGAYADVSIRALFAAREWDASDPTAPFQPYAFTTMRVRRPASDTSYHRGERSVRTDLSHQANGADPMGVDVRSTVVTLPPPLPEYPLPALEEVSGPRRLVDNIVPTLYALLRGLDVAEDSSDLPDFTRLRRHTFIMDQYVPLEGAAYADCGRAALMAGTHFGGDGRDFYADSNRFRTRNDDTIDWVTETLGGGGSIGKTRLYRQVGDNYEFIDEDRAVVGPSMTNVQTTPDWGKEKVYFDHSQEVANPYCGLIPALPGFESSNAGITWENQTTVFRDNIVKGVGSHDQYPSYGLYRMDDNDGSRVIHIWRQTQPNCISNAPVFGCPRTEYSEQVAH